MDRLKYSASRVALGGYAVASAREYQGDVNRIGPKQEPLTVTVPGALEASGLGRTKLYELIAKREIESVLVGKRRLVNYSSLKAFLTSKGSIYDPE